MKCGSRKHSLPASFYNHTNTVKWQCNIILYVAMVVTATFYLTGCYVCYLLVSSRHMNHSYLTWRAISLMIFKRISHVTVEHERSLEMKGRHIQKLCNPHHHLASLSLSSSYHHIGGVKKILHLLDLDAFFTWMIDCRNLQCLVYTSSVFSYFSFASSWTMSKIPCLWGPFWPRRRSCLCIHGGSSPSRSLLLHPIVD